MTDYKDRLKISHEGDKDLQLFQNGELIAKGYNIVVFGKRGPYLEFEKGNLCWDNIHLKPEHRWRLTTPYAYYVEYHTIKSDVKIYYQLKTVDYADYLIGKFYISPFELCTEDGKVLIEKLKKV